MCFCRLDQSCNAVLVLQNTIPDNAQYKHTLTYLHTHSHLEGWLWPPFFSNATLSHSNSYCVDDNQETLGKWLLWYWQLLQMGSQGCWNVVMSWVLERLPFNTHFFMCKSRNRTLDAGWRIPAFEIPVTRVDTAKIVLRLKDGLLLWRFHISSCVFKSLIKKSKKG